MIDQLTTNATADRLCVHWDDGSESQISAETLRKAARDAWSIRQRLDTGSVPVSPGLAITGLFQIGNGVNIHFSDGHEKAIYPFPYLRELSGQCDK